MESVDRKQKKQRKREESTPLKRKKLTEEHESSLSEDEAMPITKKKKQLEETTKQKRKEQNGVKVKSPEATPSLQKEEERDKRKKKEKQKQKKKKKEPIGNIAEDEPQLDQSAHAHHKATAVDVSFRLLVPSTDLGKVIGPHGSRIQQLREDTGAHIKIGDAIMNLSERLVWISSKEDSLKSQSAAERALLRVATLLMEPSNEEEETTKLRLLIAGSQANSMVDEAGVVTGKISENTEAIVTILKKNMFPLLALASETDRLVQLEGKVSQVLKALGLIAIRLRGSPPRTTGANGRKNGGAFKARVEIRIPNDLTGKLIGKNGATIQQLQRQCGVSLEVGESKEGGKYRTVHLRGMLSQVTMAQTLLQVFLASKQRAR